MARTDYGPCCYCGGTENVRNILMLPFEAPSGFHGWACLQCHRPPRGASALLCDQCIVDDRVEPKFICGGKYIEDGVRVPLEGYTRIPFHHDMSLHPEEQQHDRRH